MPILSDLKHVLDSVHGEDVFIRGVYLDVPVETEDDLFDKITKVSLKGKIYKVHNQEGDSVTLSRTTNEFQGALYRNLLSMKDKRVTASNYKVNLFY